MSEFNKSYRIRTNVGQDKYVSVNLEQDYDAFDILSLKIDSSDVYKLHNSNYGVIVGRVLANNGFGVPNAKISVFIAADGGDDVEVSSIYPFNSTGSYNSDGVRYNLLPDEEVSDCHQVVGTFPNKRYLLDNDVLLEVFDKYYRYTTRTNNSGDYMLVGIPVGQQQLHMDLDISDCGILSQRPRDFVYKGYTIEQFENPNKFKGGYEYGNLSQVFTQDETVNVYPFWGNGENGETIGITRADINIAFKFEPTCVFLGSVVSDNSSQGISKKCVPTGRMGAMDELVTGKGTIEMIRKTYGGNVEEFQIKGTELIDGNGIWCYQIPMNLDYVMTDEFGNMVPTDNPEKGLPTRARVRFRISMQDFDENVDNYFRPKVLVPHNPSFDGDDAHYDYEFGTDTEEGSYRDLMWNNVYTVKSYVPRFQRKQMSPFRTDKFTGIKNCNIYGQNNPMPYNNIRIKMPFMFIVMCLLIKTFILICGVVNNIVAAVGRLLKTLGQNERVKDLHLLTIDEGLCPDLDNWYFAPVANKDWLTKTIRKTSNFNILEQTVDYLQNDGNTLDSKSIDYNNVDKQTEAICLTINTDYLISCIEMNLAQEYKVINFDFYNDWVNGTIYIPRFMRYIRKKRKFLGRTIVQSKVKGCMDNPYIFSRTRRYTQQCAVAYSMQANSDGYNVNTKVVIPTGNKLHKKDGTKQINIFDNGGVCHTHETMKKQNVYYLKPCEWTVLPNKKVNLFATDVVLLGSLNDCDIYGVPQAFKHLNGTSYIMPTNLALTNMDTDGYLYAYGDEGTVCSQYNQTEDVEGKEAVDILQTGINEIPSSSLTAEYHYSWLVEGNVNPGQSDTMPVTEAAGIAWNYTGPDQKSENGNVLYYPGGHFLGMSCVNSQTNIKSCVNLSRICEVGSSMSQRREDVRMVDKANGDTLKYVYNVPTGIISGDDIVDGEFRAMFATMNQKKLLCTKKLDNGYKGYDFTFVYPTNFNGELVDFVDRGGGYYNTGITVYDESSSLSAYGVKPASDNDDYDPEQTAYTQTKTSEGYSVDYYKFRFGLSDSELQGRRYQSRFLYNEGNNLYLPQYENSFYFYFGLHDGSTAIDEFNKQFFSECENNVLFSSEMRVETSVGGFAFCEGTSEVMFTVYNMEAPYYYEVRYSTGSTMVSGTTRADQFTEELPRGEYIIFIRDYSGKEIMREFSVAMNMFPTLNMYSVGFNEPWGVDSDNVKRRDLSNKDMFVGGYVYIDNLKFNNEMTGGNDYKIYSIRAMKDDNTLDPAIDSEVVTDFSQPATLYLASAYQQYDIYVEYKCDDEDSESVYMFLGNVYLTDNRDIDMTIGPLGVSISGYTDSTVGTNILYKPEGWKEVVEPSESQYMFYSTNLKEALISGAYSLSSVTMSSNVLVPENGKALFGSPQNRNGILKDGILYSDYGDYGLHPEADGYDLDDSRSYYATYGVDYRENVRDYSSVGFDGNNVYGYPVGKIIGRMADTQGLRQFNGIGDRYRNCNVGGGCLIKLLPTGQIIDGEIHSIDTTQATGKVKLYGDIADNVPISGVVYSTISYPVIDKPFTVKGNFFYLNRVGITKNENDQSYVTEGYDGFKYEFAIQNGITYQYKKPLHLDSKYYFSDKSKMTNNRSMEISTDYSDISGCTSSHTMNRILYKHDFKEMSGDNTIESPFYSIVEGYPLYYIESQQEWSPIKVGDSRPDSDAEALYGSIVHRRELTMDETVFYDNIKYKLNAGTGTLMVSGIGNSEDGVDYYVAKQPLRDKIVTEGGYLYTVYYFDDNHNKLPSQVYFAGLLTNKYDTDLNGKPCLIRCYREGGDTYYGCQVYYNGVSIYTKGYLVDFGSISVPLADVIYSLAGHIDKLQEGYFKCAKQKTLTQAAKDGGDNFAGYSLTQLILNNIDSHISDIVKLDDNMTCRVGSENVLVIGVDRHLDNKQAEGNLCCLYFNPLREEYEYGDGSIMLYSGHTSSEVVTVDGLDALPYSVEVGAMEGEIPITVYSESGVTWAYLVNEDDVFVSVNPVTGGNPSTKYTLLQGKITYPMNNSVNDRDNTIVFYDSNSQDTGLTCVAVNVHQLSLENTWLEGAWRQNIGDFVVVDGNEDYYVEFTKQLFNGIELSGNVTTVQMINSSYTVFVSEQTLSLPYCESLPTFYFYSSDIERIDNNEPAVINLRYYTAETQTGSTRNYLSEPLSYYYGGESNDITLRSMVVKGIEDVVITTPRNTLDVYVECELTNVRKLTLRENSNVPFGEPFGFKYKVNGLDA